MSRGPLPLRTDERLIFALDVPGRAEAIDWVEKPSTALFDDRAPIYEWFSDGMVNACWNAAAACR